jgi:hypothetical protein
MKDRDRQTNDGKGKRVREKLDSAPISHFNTPRQMSINDQPAQYKIKQLHKFEFNKVLSGSKRHMRTLKIHHRHKETQEDRKKKTRTYTSYLA